MEIIFGYRTNDLQPKKKVAKKFPISAHSGMVNVLWKSIDACSHL